MSGTMPHVDFGKITYEDLRKRGAILNLQSYMAGNLLPDYALDKAAAHMYYPDIISGFHVPNLMEAVLQYEGIANKSLCLGIIAHLYLDKYFTKNVIAKHFKITRSGRVVPVSGNSSALGWSMEEFFSYEQGIYRAYSECNPLILEREDISMDWICDNVPYELPLTGLKVLDTRTEDNWRDQLERRLAHALVYTGEMLSYAELIGAVKKAAKKFVEFAG